MSTSSPENILDLEVRSVYSVHHHRAAASLLAAAGYAVAVVVTGSPVVLLAGLFVPLSIGAESTFRAARRGPLDRRAGALVTGLGVVVGALTTATVVFAAGAIGL